MTGSIQSKKGKLYMVLSFKDKSEEFRTKWISTGLDAKGNKKKAQQMLNEKLDECKSLEYLDMAQLLFSDFIIQWLELFRRTWEETTYRNYYNIIHNCIAPYFKGKKLLLQDLKPEHIQRFYAKRMDEGVSANTIRRYHANILKSLDYAQSEGYIIANPAKRVALPKLEKYVASFYNQDELNRLFKAVKGTRMETITLLTAYYGLRRSEVLGLKWQSIDFAGNCIIIENKVIHAKEGDKVVVKSKPNLKNTSSRRSLPLIRMFGYILKSFMSSKRLIKRRTSYIIPRNIRAMSVLMKLVN